MHEIITLQLGQRSNYLATHFWNTQESYFTYSSNETSPVDHDVNFRPGIGADGSETYTPRTIIYDLKGGFGTLRQYNALYDVAEGSESANLWHGNETVRKQPPIPQSEYQKSLDSGLPPPKLTSESVRYWSDFNRVFYNPKSIVQLNEYDLNSQLMPFEDWTVGETLFNELDRENDLLDRDFRPFAEECDQLQGIQIFTGTDDSWGGFGSKYINRLKDEYGRKNIWVWALDDGGQVERSKQFLRARNSAKSITEISPEVTAYIPIKDLPSHLPPYARVDAHSEWSRSALLSVAVETITLPSRLRRYGGLGAWMQDTESSQRIFSLLASTVRKQGPDLNPASQEKEEPSMIENGDEIRDLVRSFDIDFSALGPSRSKDMHVFKHVQMLRDSKAETNQEQQGQAGNAPPTHRQLFNAHAPSTVSSFDSTLEFPILDSFPSDLISGQGSPGTTLGVQAALSATSDISTSLKELQRTIGRKVSIEEREELCNGLSELSAGYQAHWENDSGSDDDE